MGLTEIIIVMDINIFMNEVNPERKKTGIKTATQSNQSNTDSRLLILRVDRDWIRTEAELD